MSYSSFFLHLRPIASAPCKMRSPALRARDTVNSEMDLRSAADNSGVTVSSSCINLWSKFSPLIFLLMVSDDLNFLEEAEDFFMGAISACDEKWK